MALSMTGLRGSTQLLFDCVKGVSGSVEQMHETIARRPLPFSQRPAEPTRAHGFIAAGVYATIQNISGALAVGLDHTMGLVPGSRDAAGLTGNEARWTGVLNGVCGDHLEASDNALAIPMTLMSPQRRLEPMAESLSAAYPDAGPDIIILIHGLTQTEHCWTRGGKPGLGARLQEELGSSAVYLRYNSGRHISTNGRELAGLLEQLCSAWPVPVESVTLVGHSMGGLVSRSACWYAHQSGFSWPEKLRRVLFLGTPHHGSHLEKAGYVFDFVMQTIQYVEPILFSRNRSAGIKDLRHGNLLDEDWKGQDSGRLNPDSRRPVPLLSGVEYFFAAATVGSDEQDLKGKILGDLLVRMGSATGSHRDQLRQLQVNPGHCRIFPEKNHLDLLDDERVHEQVIDWFRTEARPELRSF